LRADESLNRDHGRTQEASVLPSARRRQWLN
jgi:hypothetical protein